MNFLRRNKAVSFSYHFKRHSSFLIGVARILDITTSLSSHKRLYKHNSGHEDSYAIYSDWKAIGDDIKGAIGGTFSLPK